MSDPTAALTTAIDYTSRGWRVIPIPTRRKNPGFGGWTDLRLDVEDLPARFPPTVAQNIGVLLGVPSDGLADLDLDCPEARGLVIEFFPPSMSFGRPGNPSSHHIYRSPGAITWQCPDPEAGAREKGTILELRSTGLQTVFPPSIHESGEPITWERESPPTDVPSTDIRMMSARLASCTLLVRRAWPRADAVTIARLPATDLHDHLIQEVRGLPQAAAFLAAIQRGLGIQSVSDRPITGAIEPSAGRPGDDFAGRTSWHEILEPHGWKVVRQSESGDATRWRRPGKTNGMSATTGYCGDRLYVFSSSTCFQAGRTYGKFAAWAVLNHGGDFKAAARALSADGFGTQPGPPPTDPASEFSVVETTPDIDAPQKIGRELRGIAFVDINPDFSRPDIVDGWIGMNSQGMIYGASGAAKTFLALDLGFHIATGRRWFNLAVEQGGVVYAAVEAPGGVQRRMKAIKVHHQMEGVHVPFWVMPEPLNFLRSRADCDALTRYVESLNPVTPVRAVFIDTLARTAVGGDENSFETMSILADRMGELSRRTGTTVCAIHHAGKNLEMGARGHSAMKCAMDFEIEVKRERDFRLATLTKSKDGEDGSRIGFYLLPVEIGRRGKMPVFAAVVSPMAQEDIRRPPEGLAMVALETIQTLAVGGRRIGLDSWRTAFIATMAGQGGKYETARKSFYRTHRSLIPGWVRTDGTVFWIADESATAEMEFTSVEPDAVEDPSPITAPDAVIGDQASPKTASDAVIGDRVLTGHRWDIVGCPRSKTPSRAAEADLSTFLACSDDKPENTHLQGSRDIDGTSRKTAQDADGTSWDIGGTSDNVPPRHQTLGHVGHTPLGVSHVSRGLPPNGAIRSRGGRPRKKEALD